VRELDLTGEGHGGALLRRGSGQQSARWPAQPTTAQRQGGCQGISVTVKVRRCIGLDVRSGRSRAGGEVSRCGPQFGRQRHDDGVFDRLGRSRRTVHRRGRTISRARRDDRVSERVCSGTWGRVRMWGRTMTRTATAVHVRPLPIPARGETRAIHWPVAWALSRHRTRCGTSPGRRRHICTSTQQRQHRPRPTGCDRRLSACPSGQPGVSAARSWAAHRNLKPLCTLLAQPCPPYARRRACRGRCPSATAAGTSRMPPAASGESPPAFARHCASSSRPRTPAARYLLHFPPVVGWTPMPTGPAQAASCSR
jgi:hypothetical protein